MRTRFGPPAAPPKGGTRAGMSIVELVLALGVLAMAMVVFLTVFSSSGSQALQTRNRTAAILLANSLIDEIEAHPYGDKAPLSWATGVERPATVVVAGRDQQMEFYQELKFENGSFVGTGGTSQTRDLVTVTLTWKESAGGDQTTNGRSDDNKELVVRVPVWR